MNENNNTSQNSNAILIAVFAAILILPWLINEYLIKYYVAGWYWIMYAKIWVLYKITSFSIVSDNLDTILFWADWFIVEGRFAKDQLYPLINQVYSVLINADTSTLEGLRDSFTAGGEFNDDFRRVGRIAVAIYFPLYLYFSIKLTYKLLVVKKYDTVFTLDEFAQTMAEGFPELLPVVYDNPLKYDLDKGHWRMSPKIFTYLKDNGCITEFIEDGKELFRLNEEQTSDLLVTQLGKKWEGFDALDHNYRTLVAMALPMVNSPAKGKKATYELIEALGFAYSMRPTFIPCLKKGVKGILFGILNPNLYVGSKAKKTRKAFFKDANGIILGYQETKRRKKYRRISNSMIAKNIADFRDIPAVKDILRKHAYNSTVVSALIESARLGGVLPSCSSLWLKKEDRNLFYVFNNLGRHVAWVEVVGFWAHYLNEKKVGAPFPYPKVENGVEGIDDALFNSFYNYVPLNERKN